MVELAMGGVNIKDGMKRLACPMLLRAGYFGRRLGAIDNSAVILMYHKITDGNDNGVVKERFRAQMEYFRERMNPVGLGDIASFISGSSPLPPRAISITFDDGYEDNFTNAYPTLKTLGIPATIFVTTGHIETDRSFWWDRVGEVLKKTKKPSIDLGIFKRFAGGVIPPRIIGLSTGAQRVAATRAVEALLKSIEHQKIPEATAFIQERLEVADKDIKLPRMLTWSRIREMSDNGIDFGAHTITHPDLARIDIREADREIRESKKILEEKLGKAVEGFAYPYGLAHHYNVEVARAVRTAGFRYACTAEGGIVTRGSKPFELRRISVPNASLGYSLWNILRHF